MEKEAKRLLPVKNLINPKHGRSLLEKFPELCKEWDYEKNYPLTPKDVSYGSQKKAYWICKNGHEWCTVIRYRSNGNNCPYCYGHKVSIDNCLATLNPKLALEWHPTKNGKLTPYDVTCGSNKKVVWKCNSGHEWLTTLHERILCGCPYCSGHKVCIDNCLATLNPKLALEWHPTKNGKLTPYDVTVNSGIKAYWTCNNGHFYVMPIISRNSGQCCPYCSGKKVCEDNCLATVDPILAKEWNYKRNGKLTPHNVTQYSHINVWWECNSGHEWESKISDRSCGNGCPICIKVILKNGIICDSLPEAYYCQELDDDGIKFKHHVKIGFGKCICDFYIPSTNTYIEVTGYNKKWKYWKTYRKGILRKKRYIIKILKAGFKFVQLKLNTKQIQYVRKNML